MKVYIVKELKCKILAEINVLILYNIILDFNWKLITVWVYESLINNIKMQWI